MTEGANWVVLGRISGTYGVRGWVKIHSYTEPRENILSYTPWQMRASDQPDAPRRSVSVLDGRVQGKGIVVHLEGWDTPEAARALVGAEIVIPREQLPAPHTGEYYWNDLLGLQVVTADSVLGTVTALMETGANDVLVVQAPGAGKSASGKQHLIPFIDGVIVSVDLDAKRLRVDWDVDY
jgi:16S rRNA processing protein RimM